MRAENGSGQISSLFDIEPQFVTSIIQMIRIGDTLTPSKALALINNTMDGTSRQDHIRQWKKIHTNGVTDDNLGQVGYKYWLNFKERNDDMIVSREGEHFESDRSSWTTYHNFAQMFKLFGDEI